MSAEVARGRSRDMEAVKLRKAFWRELSRAGWSAKQIGRLTGHHHTTVLYGLGRLRKCTQRRAAQ